MIAYKEEGVILKAENICLKYGDKEILRDVSFAINDVTRPGMQQGQVVSLIGRSGIGKTQLFKICAGLLQPNKGTVKIGFEQTPIKSGDVGIVPQNYILFNHRSVYKNLLIAIDHDGTKKTEKQKDDIIRKFAEDFELTEHLLKFPMQLSGGQRQRVSILQQVLTGNKFVLLDEPFSGLDALMVDKVIALLLKISLLDELNTLILVSHDILNSMAISDLVWVLAKEKGRENEGATIVKSMDLKKDGLAWRPDIRHDKQFQDLLGTVKATI